MVILLSPAKDLDTNEEELDAKVTTPPFLDKSEVLATALKKKSARQLVNLMGVSKNLGELNHQRFQEWKLPHDKGAKSALSIFNGEVYRGIEASSMTKQDRAHAQQYVRILSGLYGILRPNDLIMPYRLEMGTKMSIRRNKNLYDFWGDSITQSLNESIESSGSNCVLNLASNEYFKAVDPKLIKVPVVTATFKDITPSGEYKVKFAYAKRQRGRMTRFLIEHRALDPEVMRGYDLDDYRFSEADSNDGNYVFLRG